MQPSAILLLNGLWVQPCSGYRHLVYVHDPPAGVHDADGDRTSDRKNASIDPDACRGEEAADGNSVFPSPARLSGSHVDMELLQSTAALLALLDRVGTPCGGLGCGISDNEVYIEGDG
ncbi:hypothetical protein VTN00DRAFT_2153 [Thermoascus crustaceus]|uniref:uncharacterized protein n=1 Tax=Thermoascus crustaceus TaxID=5088 RepID=UPI003743A677